MLIYFYCSVLATVFPQIKIVGGIAALKSHNIPHWIVEQNKMEASKIFVLK